MEGWKNALATVKKEAPGALVIARTTPPGHPGCGQYKQPLKQPIDLAGKTSYNWEHFARQNALLRELVSSAYPGVLLYDVEGPVALRADAHREGQSYDCLHFGGSRGNDMMGELWLLLRAQLALTLDSAQGKAA